MPNEIGELFAEALAEKDAPGLLAHTVSGDPAAIVHPPYPFPT